MRVDLTHPPGNIKNKVSIYLTDKDIDVLSHMPESGAMTVCLGYELLVIVRREKEERK